MGFQAQIMETNSEDIKETGLSRISKIVKELFGFFKSYFSFEHI